MICGIGTDIVKIERMEEMYSEKTGNFSAFFNKSFTKKELLEAEAKPNKAEYFSSRFAAKEAVFKSLDIPTDIKRLENIEILNDENGKPYVNLLGTLLDEANKQKITKIHISISHETEYVIAYVIAEK